MIVAFDHQLERTHGVPWVGYWQLCDKCTRAERVAFFYFMTAAELACFHNFCRHLLTNTVRNLLVSARFSPEWHSVSQTE